jgi:hypothetical protein
VERLGAEGCVIDHAAGGAGSAIQCEGLQPSMPASDTQ